MYECPTTTFPSSFTARALAQVCPDKSPRSSIPAAVQRTIRAPCAASAYPTITEPSAFAACARTQAELGAPSSPGSATIPPAWVHLNASTGPKMPPVWLIPTIVDPSRLMPNAWVREPPGRRCGSCCMPVASVQRNATPNVLAPLLPTSHWPTTVWPSPLMPLARLVWWPGSTPKSWGRPLPGQRKARASAPWNARVKPASVPPLLLRAVGTVNAGIPGSKPKS